ncbi:MAG: hypothetical protein ABIS36_25265 [Chryseolinea sp.]
MEIDEIYIEKLVASFENKTLSATEWTHEAHIVVAVWNILHYPEKIALDKFRQSIIDYNSSIGTLNTDSAGYHETITRFWMTFLRKYIVFHKLDQTLAVYQSLYRSNLIDRAMTLEYYSKALLFSPRARRSLIAPDKRRIVELDIVIRKSAHFHLTDADFEKQLEKCILDPSIFTHEAHLRMAYIKIRAFGVSEAVAIVSSEIENYVKFRGAQDKFNKTLTIAAVNTVNHFMNKAKSLTFTDLMIEFPRLKYNFRELISTHYGFDIFNSTQAKKEFIQPDLMPYK